MALQDKKACKATKNIIKLIYESGRKFFQKGIYSYFTTRTLITPSIAESFPTTSSETDVAVSRREYA